VLFGGSRWADEAREEELEEAPGGHDELVLAGGGTQQAESILGAVARIPGPSRLHWEAEAGAQVHTVAPQEAAGSGHEPSGGVVA
jgi:hypothetical protein